MTFLNSDSITEKLAAIVESSGDAIISKDLNGIITSWNRGAANLFGYTADEVIGLPITVLMPEDRVNEEPGILERIRRGETVDHYETIRRHKDGRLLDISINVSPIVDQNGVIIGASKIARDITDRKRAHAELAKLAAIVEATSDAIISKDLDGIITSWNRGAETIFGYTADEAIGRPVTMLIPDDRIDEEPGILAKIRRGERVDHYETVRRHKDGRLLDISLNISPVVDSHGVIVGASKIARDITEHKMVASAIRETETMQRLVEAQESERHRIARDLHDHLGQQMTGLRLKIESLIAHGGGGDAFQQDIDGVREIARQIDRDIGFLSWELRPTELEHLGLEDALSSFVHEWSRQYNIEATFKSNFSEQEFSIKKARLAKNFETNLYRIVQEGLNNILKHANASRVGILLHHRKNAIVLVIEDDGQGFDPASQTLPKKTKFGGFGVVGMQERATLLKGTFELESRSGMGTTLLITIPI